MCDKNGAGVVSLGSGAKWQVRFHDKKGKMPASFPPRYGFTRRTEIWLNWLRKKHFLKQSLLCRNT